MNARRSVCSLPSRFAADPDPTSSHRSFILRFPELRVIFIFFFFFKVFRGYIFTLKYKLLPATLHSRTNAYKFATGFLFFGFSVIYAPLLILQLVNLNPFFAIAFILLFLSLTLSRVFTITRACFFYPS